MLDIEVSALPYEYELIDHPKTVWAVDSDFNLYIIPPLSYADGIHGPESDTKKSLQFLVAWVEGTPSVEQVENLGLVYIEPKYRGYNSVDGYFYH